MDLLRTPDTRFDALPDWPYAPRYVEVEGIRMHYVDEGPPDAAPVLLLHGEPTWAYLYRKMIPVLVAAGHRAVAPDLVGFGRSDKPSRREDYAYARQVGWLAGWMEAVGLRRITLVCQDWGSLLGLRLAAEHEARFDRIVVANGFLPTGRGRVPAIFRLWQAFARWSPWFPVSLVVRVGCRSNPPGPAERRAYEAPFPSARHKVAARRMPQLVPTRPDDPAAADNQRAWEALGRWRKPFLTAFGTLDPIFGGLDRVLQRHVPGAAGQPHTRLEGASHFIQEDAGEALARVVADFIARTRD